MKLDRLHWTLLVLVACLATVLIIGPYKPAKRQARSSGWADDAGIFGKKFVDDLDLWRGYY